MASTGREAAHATFAICLLFARDMFCVSSSTVEAQQDYNEGGRKEGLRENENGTLCRPLTSLKRLFTMITVLEPWMT